MTGKCVLPQYLADMGVYPKMGFAGLTFVPQRWTSYL